MSPAMVDMYSRDGATWKERLDYIVETMREMSTIPEPEAMVEAYGARVRANFTDVLLSISRRGVAPPKFVLARDSRWEVQANPWKERHKLPVLEGGFLGEIVYAGEPRIFDDLALPADDPHRHLFEGYGSLVSVPLFDNGEALNTVVLLRKPRNGFDRETLPFVVWTTSLFGRASHNLVLSRQLREAYAELDREARLVADIQRTLLPADLPRIPGVDLAAFYRPATRAGGDYYDFFPLADGRFGMLIADVSGHGTPAAVEMAITRTLAHAHAREIHEPAGVLEFVNANLSSRYTRAHGTFVTAFYGLYDPAARTIRYASAGHHPPRVKRCSDGTLFSLAAPPAPPLGVLPKLRFEEGRTQLAGADQLVLYTDGITEAMSPAGELFGLDRLDATLHDCRLDAKGLVDDVVREVERFSGGGEPRDDQTLIAARIAP